MHQNQNTAPAVCDLCYETAGRIQEPTPWDIRAARHPPPAPVAGLPMKQGTWHYVEGVCDICGEELPPADASTAGQP